MLDDFKFIAATGAGLGICICLALFALLLTFAMVTRDAEPDEVIGAIGWLVAVLAACVAIYVWGQS